MKPKAGETPCAFCGCDMQGEDTYEIKIWRLFIKKLLPQGKYDYLGTILICLKCGDKFAGKLYERREEFKRTQTPRT